MTTRHPHNKQSASQTQPILRTPFDETTSASLDESAVRSLRKLLMSSAAGLTQKPLHNLTKLIETARSMGVPIPALEEGDDLAKLSLPKTVAIFNQVSRAVLLPRGELFHVNFIGAPQIWRGTLGKRGWEMVPFAARHPIWFSEVCFEKTPPDSYGFSLRNCAFVDPRQALTDNHRMYAFLKSPNSRPLEAVSPYSAELKTLISREGIDGATYAQVCGYQRTKLEEINHCRDDIFMDAHGNEGAEAEARVKRIRSLLKTGTKLSDSLVSAREMMGETGLMLAAVLEASAHFAGIFEEVAALNQDGRFGLAYAAFLDFFLIMAVKENATNLRLNDLPYTRIGSIADEALRCLGLQSHGEVLSHLQSAPDHPGIAAQHLLDKMRRVHFYTTEEKLLVLEQDSPAVM